jgi:hypothetical protein
VPYDPRLPHHLRLFMAGLPPSKAHARLPYPPHCPTALSLLPPQWPAASSLLQ